jgi:hypothetical protein
MVSSAQKWLSNRINIVLALAGTTMHLLQYAIFVHTDGKWDRTLDLVDYGKYEMAETTRQTCRMDGPRPRMLGGRGTNHPTR